MDNKKQASLFCATVLYPNKEGARFDFDLYADKLIPEYADILGDNCVRYEVRKGLATPGASFPAFLCIASIWVKSAEQFGRTMSDPRMSELMKRISAFTEIEPVRQFDEVIA
jgi:uncharacterized protein (TIGR02118 family)